MELDRNVLTLPKHRIASCTILVAILLVAFAIVPSVMANEQDQSAEMTFQSISVNSAYQMITHGSYPNLVILDVRNQTEYDVGHLYNAVLIPLNELGKRMRELQGLEDHEIIVYCGSGTRSKMACEILVGYGFAKVYNMIGGITAWIEAGYPIWTTYHYVTVKVVDTEIMLRIKPLLLPNAVCQSCQANQGCQASADERGNIQFTVLEQEEGHTAILMTYEVKGTRYEVTIANTLLWSYNALVNGVNRTASFVLTEVSTEGESTQFYSFNYIVQSAQYNLTLYTALTSLDSETYNSSFTFMNYVPAGGSEVSSVEIVDFNSSVTFSQQYGILGKVAKEVGKVYEKSGDPTLLTLASSYYTMETECKFLSKLAEKNLQAYDRNILWLSATIMDFTCAESCGMVCGPWGGLICGAVCSWALGLAGIGFIICMGGCLAGWGMFCSWLCNSLCGQPVTIQRLGCAAVCANVCSFCPSGNPACMLCGVACGRVCMGVLDWIQSQVSPPQPPTTPYAAGNQVYATSGTLSASGATYTFSVSSLSGTYTVVMVGNELADFDLYVRWNAAPTTSSFDAVSGSIYSSEYVTVTGSGTLYVMVRSWYGNGNWRCNVVTGSPSAISGRQIGSLGGTGSTATYSLVGHGPAWVYLAGPDSSDFDLYVRWNAAPTTSTYDCRGFWGWSEEICSAVGSGTLYYMANSYYGSGEYTMLAIIFPSPGDELSSVSGSLSASGATYTFSVSPLSGTFTVVMVGNELADFDLYVRWNAAPTTSSFDAVSGSIYSSEYVTVTGSGTLYVMVRSWYGNGNWRCDVISGSPAVDGGRKVGSLGGSGSAATYSLAASGRAWVYLAGPDSSDFDLYIRWNAAPTTSTYDCRGFSGWSQEICNARNSGTLYYMAESWYGSGEYTMLALVF